MRFNAYNLMIRSYSVPQGGHLSRAGRRKALSRALSHRPRPYREPMFRKLPAMRRKSKMFEREWDRKFESQHEDLFSVEAGLAAFAHIDAHA